MDKYRAEKERGRRIWEQEEKLLQKAGITRRQLRYKQGLHNKLSQNKRYNIRFASLLDEFRFKPLR